jgi:3',5'-cyclic AMP phosphodiesterase CpdA
MFTLAHISDIHLAPLPRPRLHHLLSKRVLGYANWTRRRFRHRRDVLDRLMADLAAQGPDHIALTGDLVNIALPEEFRAARTWLEGVAGPEGITVIPGNHDAYVPGALAQTRRQWRDFMTGDHDPSSVVFPFVRHRGPIAIIGVNSARATAPFMATGHLGERQLEMLRLTLRQEHRHEKFRVVLLHHPPAPETRHRTQRLVEADAFLKVIAEEGAELVLHGHLHAGSLVYVEGKHGEVPVVGVPSASNPPGNLHAAAAFNLYHIAGKPGDFSCHMKSVGFTKRGVPARLIADRQLLG